MQHPIFTRVEDFAAKSWNILFTNKRASAAGVSNGTTEGSKVKVCTLIGNLEGVSNGTAEGSSVGS
eukprot:scaffold8161_cov44-Cyclotella_meneghiniana.AAC.1